MLKRVILYLHKLKLFWAENTEIVMEVSYEQQTRVDIKIIVDTCIFLNHSEDFVYIEGADTIYLRLYEDPKILVSGDAPSEKRLIKSTVINLANYPHDALLKTTLVLSDNHRESSVALNYTSSEIDISILLLTERSSFSQPTPYPLSRA